MLSFLPPPAKGVFSLAMYTANTLVLVTVLIFFALFKFILPFRTATIFIDRVLIFISTLWISINSLNTRLFCNIVWDIRGLDALKQREWYLVLSIISPGWIFWSFKRF